MCARHFLHKDAFCCQVENSIVFLHAGTCEYLAVDIDRLSEISSHVAGGATLCVMNRAQPSASCNVESRLLMDLTRRGILTTSPDQGRPIAPVVSQLRISLPSTSYGIDASRPHVADAWHFMTALAKVIRRLRRRDLLHFVRRIADEKAAIGSHLSLTDASRAAVLTRKFDRLRVWSYTAENACLKDALVLAEFLLRSGCAPTLVIGVRTKPFAAHAWVQSGDVVLNDSVEHAQQYTPILVV